MARFLTSGQTVADQNGTAAAQYMTKFGGYDVSAMINRAWPVIKPTIAEPPIDPPRVLFTGSNAGDVLVGNELNNVLYGLHGNDVMVGQFGRDKLFGGLGLDSLYGGSGRDSFVFNTKPNKLTNVDKVFDFRSTDDVFQIDNQYLTRVGNDGKLKAASFCLGTKARDPSDRVVYNQATGDLFYDDDGNGPHAAIKIAVLMTRPKIGLADFQII